MRRGIITFTLLLGACGAGDGIGVDRRVGEYGGPRATAAAGLEGDWFVCEDLDCTELSDEGLRFDPLGLVLAIEARGARLEPDEPYCIEDFVGTYRTQISGPDLLLELTLGFANAKVALPVQWLEPERRMVLPDLEDLEGLTALQRIVPSRLSESCDVDVPQPGRAVPPPPDDAPTTPGRAPG